MRILLALVIFTLPGSLVWLHAQDYDVVLRHGQVVDGTGNPAISADVAVKEGRIAAIGRIQGKGKLELDAKGMVIAPGFIDVHTHADEVAEMPLAENFVRMGVTTIVAGNCGASCLDVAKFFAQIERTNPAVNVATLVGHNDVRAKAMGGNFDRPPSATELAEMKALVKRAMQDGAIGLSTGLIYQPGVFSKTEEIIELAKVAAAFDGIYTSHMRHEDNEIFKALNEVFRIAREAGIRAEISHIKLSGPNAWGQANRVLKAIEEARASGIEVTQDEYAYTASSTSISQLVPDWALEAGRDKFKERLANPELKAKMATDMQANLERRGRTNYEYAVIASYRKNPALNGLSILQAAKATRGKDSLEDQIETILEIQREGGASGVFHGMSEEDMQTFMQHPNTMIACDSGLRKFGEGVPHPRGYGNNARVLARYVRDLKVLRLEDAVRKMTSLPANTFRLKDRGVIRQGGWADLVVFDPIKIQDLATFEEPHHYPAGIEWVLVNGIPVLERGKHTGAKAGKSLRHAPFCDPARDN